MSLKTIFSILLLFCNIVLSNAQSKEILAKSAMLNAEEAYNNENYSECFSYLKEAETTLGKTDSRIQYLKVKALMVIEDWEQAEAEVKVYFEITPESEAAPEKYDEMVLAVSKIKRAIIAAEKKNTNDIAKAKEEIIRAQKGEQMYLDAKNKNSIEAYQKYIQNYPDGKYVSEINEKIASIKEQQAKIQEYTQQIELNPKNSLAYYGRGIYKNQLEDYRSAIQDFNKCIDIDKKDADCYCSRGFAKLLLQDFQGAIIDLTKTINLNPKDAEAFYLLGSARYYVNDFQGAIPDYTKTIELNPTKREAYFMRGIARYRLSDFQGAIPDYNKSIELDNQNSETYLYRGFCKNMLKDYKAASQDFTKTIEMNPTELFSYYYRGKIYQVHFNNIEAAKSDFEKVISLNTDSTLVAFSHFFLGNKESALILLNELINTSANNLEKQKGAYYSLANLYSLDNNIPEAIKALTNSFEKGYNDFNWIEKDVDFDNIRNSPEFKELIDKYKRIKMESGKM